jgi:hypothetical protein
MKLHLPNPGVYAWGILVVRKIKEGEKHLWWCYMVWKAFPLTCHHRLTAEITITIKAWQRGWQNGAILHLHRITPTAGDKFRVIQRRRTHWTYIIFCYTSQHERIVEWLKHPHLLTRTHWVYGLLRR